MPESHESLPPISKLGFEPSIALAGVDPITLSQGQLIRSISELEGIVEGPALPACRHLYNMNIRTISTSANQEDGTAYIDIEYPTLSDENKRTARQIGQLYIKVVNEHGVESFQEATKSDHESSYVFTKFVTPIQATDTPETVARKLFALSEQFVPQKLLWAPVYTLDELRVDYGMSSEESVTPEDFAELGYYYDPNKETFHLSEELFKKSKFDPEVRAAIAEGDY